MPILLKIILLFVLLSFSAFFSGSESAFFSLSRFDIQVMQVKRRRRADNVAALLRHPGNLLITILVGNMLVNVSATTLMTGVLIAMVGEGAVPIAVIVMTILIIVFGEISPKVIAVEHNSLWARTGSGLLEILEIITAPLRWILQGIQKLILKKERSGDLRLNEIDIESALELAHREGAIGEKARDLVLHFLALDRITAGEIMIPQARIPCISPPFELEKVKAFFKENGEKYALLIERDKSPLLFERDSVLLANDQASAEDISRNPVYVPKNRLLAGLFDDIAGGRVEHLIVVDEHGDLAGLLSRDIILSQIFGEPIRRSRIDLNELSRVGDFYLLPADTGLREFNETFGAFLTSDNYNTLGGYLTEEFEEVPCSGKNLEKAGFIFRIVRSKPRNIERIAVKRLDR